MTCTVQDCDRPQHNLSRGWCYMHYHRWYRTGSTGEAAPRKRQQLDEQCQIPGCTKPDRESGLCPMHATRQRRHGDPLTFIPVEERALPRGPEHPHWIGDDVSYGGAHHRVNTAKGSARDHRCAQCGGPAREWSYDGTDPDEKRSPEGYAYSLRTWHYQPFCIPCHRRVDALRRRQTQGGEGEQPAAPPLGRGLHAITCTPQLTT